MGAIIKVERIRSDLRSIVGQSIWDKDFDEQRSRYYQEINDLTGRLKDDLTYNDWWGDEERALKAHRNSAV